MALEGQSACAQIGKLVSPKDPIPACKSALRLFTVFIFVSILLIIDAQAAVSKAQQGRNNCVLCIEYSGVSANKAKAPFCSMIALRYD